MKSEVTSTVPTNGCCAYRQLNTTNVFVVVICRVRVTRKQTVDRQTGTCAAVQTRKRKTLNSLRIKSTTRAQVT